MLMDKKGIKKVDFQNKKGENMNKIDYNFLGQIALEFRLSLDNICKILGKEPTEENKMEIYNNIEISANKDIGKINKYKYLLFYETFNEPTRIASVALSKTINYLKRYQKAVSENNKEKLIELENELYKTEDQFKQISGKISVDRLSDEDIEKIARYRLKNVISRKTFCEDYSIGRSSLSERENKISSNYLKHKLEILSEYHYSITKNIRKLKH